MAKATCSIEDCDNPSRSRGWCKKHYTRWRQHGDPMRGRPTLEDKFWPKVDRNGTIPPDPWVPLDTPCWLWTGPTDNKGYGIIGRSAGVKVRAHRWSYEHHIEVIPDGLLIDHLCRVRHCVNPLHMEPVTNRTNILRGHTIPARYAARSACKNGHEYQGNSYYTHPKKGRICRVCHKLRTRERRARQRRE